MEPNIRVFVNCGLHPGRTDIIAFQENNGQIVIEAEHFTGQIGAIERAWLTQTVRPDYVGFGYINTWPDKGQIYTEAITTTSPQLEYTINFTTTGIYTVWLRGYAPNGASDSVYVGLDNQSPTVVTGFAPRQWAWQAASKTFAVTEAGEHTLFLWQREDGLRLDRVLLTVSTAYQPQGSGPAENPRIEVE